MVTADPPSGLRLQRSRAPSTYFTLATALKRQNESDTACCAVNDLMPTTPTNGSHQNLM